MGGAEAGLVVCECEVGGGGAAEGKGSAPTPTCDPHQLQLLAGVEHYPVSRLQHQQAISGLL